MDNHQASSPTLCFSKVTLALTSAATTLSTTGTTTYCIRGKAYTKTAITNGATPTTDWATGAAFNAVVTNKGSIFIVGFDASGNVKAIQGSITDLDASGAFVTAPIFGGFGVVGSGANAGNFCPIGYVTVKAGSTSSASGWLFGTSNFTGVTGVTCAAVDVCAWPDRPQIA